MFSSVMSGTLFCPTFPYPNISTDFGVLSTAVRSSDSEMLGNAALLPNATRRGNSKIELETRLKL
jgi:hypothetical protein